jgi:hypothetical protein
LAKNIVYGIEYCVWKSWQYFAIVDATRKFGAEFSTFIASCSNWFWLSNLKLVVEIVLTYKNVYNIRIVQSQMEGYNLVMCEIPTTWNPNVKDLLCDEQSLLL